MTLPSGTKLGRYEIRSLIGVGGMGEVYRASDPKIGRDVAIKVLPADFAADKDRVARFEQEAQAAGALNHPNILAIYDVDTESGVLYVVSELLEGEELRHRLDEGAISLRKVAEYAQQMVSGLTAAHEKGIVHRDLKPENLFITNDERVKILDFGLAKLREPSTNVHGSEDATRRAMTDPGVVMGTAAYMSPEQVRGHAVDHRSDIFSFGVILYEMITGKRAFQQETMAETMSAIMKEEPPEITESNPNISPALERIVRRCLEKKPDRRFQSTSDLGFAIESLSAPTTTSASGLAMTASGLSEENERPKGRGRLLPIATVILGLAVIGSAVWFFGRSWLAASAASVAEVSYKAISFEKGFIYTARFAPDGRTIVYSADWEHQPLGVYVTNTDDFKYRPLGFPGADLLGVSRTGELAILNGSTVLFGNPYRRIGTLARASMTGGAARPELEGVKFADFGPNNTMAVVRDEGGRALLEYPIGQVIVQTDRSTLLSPRVSPSGEYVAYFECGADNTCHARIVDRSGKLIAESSAFFDWWALAWKASNELWFAPEVRNTDANAAKDPDGVGIYSLDLTGHQRKVFQSPIPITLHDISPQGDVLVTFDRGSPSIEFLEGADPTPKDRTWRDSGSSVNGVSTNHTLLITGKNVVGIRKPNEEQVIQIAEGDGFALSADGSKAIVASQGKSPKISIVPTGAGQPQIVDIGPVDSITWAGFLPDGRIVIKAIPPNAAPVVHLLSAAGRDPKPLLPDGITLKDAANNVVSPDGASIVATAGPGRFVLCTIATPSCRPLAGFRDEADEVAGWTADGRSLYVFNRKVTPTQIDLLDVASGKRTASKTLHPLNPSAAGITSVIVTTDGSVAYGYRKDASELYVIKGLK